MVLTFVKSMILIYKGKVKKYTARMPFLEGGPYDFSTGRCEVLDKDASILMEKSPLTFAHAEEQDGEHSCPECGKTYKRKGDLDNHIKSQHPGAVIE